ncbi:MAG: hypothetical protein Q4A12_08140, partial [Eubacteriales bacterium]|nr:hypothetical protein [Eubacteriales bacterium]
MILINSGKMNIPENEWFIGFSGDNLHSQKQFMITDFSDQNCTYNLYLTFDRKNSNGRYMTNCIKLDSKIENGSTLLLWNIKEEHILKSGLVKAQIKVEDSDGEVFYTSKGVFFVCESVDKIEYDNSSGEIIDFTQFEEKLNKIIEDFKTQSADFVPTSRKIAGEKLTTDISATQLRKALSVYPVKVLVGEEPTTSTTGSVTQLLISNIDNELKLYVCVNINGAGSSAQYQWKLLNSITAEEITKAVKSYFDENSIEFDSYVSKTRKIADIELSDDITADELKTLGIKYIFTV